LEPSPKLRIVYAGTPEFAVPALKALIESRHEVAAVYTQPDRPAGRGRKLTPGRVKRVALEHGIAVEQPERLKPADVQERLRGYAPDVMVVAAYGLILPKAVLEIPVHGCLNIHASLLPRWRGAAPIQRAILAGDAETGVTLMQMAPGLDTGDILMKARTPIGATDTAQALHDRLAEQGAELLIQGLDALTRGRLRPEPQDESLATYAGKLSKAEAQLDWFLAAATLDRQVRAFNPWPVAFTHLDDEPLRIWQARPEASPVTAPPGTVVAEGPEGIDVATGDGLLRLTRVQFPGGRPLGAREVLNSRSLLGKRLGKWEV
jgi:methionyl-tRNA formyltransferase